MSQAYYLAPSTFEHLFNRLMGKLAGWGLGPAYVHVLEVRGRKTGRLFSTPVNLLAHRGKSYLVAPRGETQWVRNAQVAGRVSLRRGRLRRWYSIKPVATTDRGPILKNYLQTYGRNVQRYFEVAASAPPEAFAAVADRYPVFELKETGPV